jgi:exodeoxyribonuclease-3
MAEQRPTDEPAMHPVPVAPPPPGVTRILTWNVRDAGPGRSRDQARWLGTADAQVLVLTEVGDRPDGLEAALRDEGFETLSPEVGPLSVGDHRIVLATRGHRLEALKPPAPHHQPHRCVAARLVPVGGGPPLVVAGMYVPSQGGVSRRHTAKRAFQGAGKTWLPRLLEAAGDAPVLIAGDLNTLEPGEVSRYENYGPWECDFYWSFAKLGLVDAYRARHPRAGDPRWFGQNLDEGYRFGHLFVSGAHAERVEACDYQEQPREKGLSDRPALIATLNDGHDGVDLDADLDAGRTLEEPCLP